MILRRESGADAAAVRAVHAAAFARSDGAVPVEVVLVDALRHDGDVVRGLSVVAQVGADVVGHVVCSRAVLAGVPVLGLGPLGVLPSHQRRGIGSALVHGVLAAADALDEPCVLVLGEVSFYARFGFRSAQSAGVRSPDPAWGEHFQNRRLSAWTEGLRGSFRYASPFDPL